MLVRSAREIMLSNLAHWAYEYQETPFKLSSGELSHDYVDCRRVLSNGTMLSLAAHLIVEALVSPSPLIGGPSSGADPLAVAVAIRPNPSIGQPTRWISIRTSVKDHGKQKVIEGHVGGCLWTILVDDVLTSGGSLIRAIDVCREEKLGVCQVVVLVDREEQDGLKRVKDHVGPKVSVRALFTKQEIIAEWNRQQSP